MNASRVLGLLLSEGRRVEPAGAVKWIIAFIAVPITVFEIWFTLLGVLDPLSLAIIFLPSMYIIGFLTLSSSKAITRIGIVEYVLSFLSLVAGLYLLANSERYVAWTPGIDEYHILDLVVGVLFLGLTAELLRRAAGPILLGVTLVLILYAFIGHNFEGILHIREYEVSYIVERLMLSDGAGVFGEPVQVAASYVFQFLLFGQLFEFANGGRYFFNLGAAIAGRQKGGIAKVSVISSGLFGMISGSPGSDVMVTGSINIPNMIRAGYSRKFAAAVEAVASTGGALMPPVMGAAVFLMVQFTGIPYSEIVKSAIGLAILYYFMVFVQVHLHADRLGLKGLDKAQVPNLRATLVNGWYYLIPFALVTYLVLEGRSPGRVAVLGAFCILILSLISPAARLSGTRILEACARVCILMAPLVGAVAAAGIVIGMLYLTGLAGSLSTIFLQLAHGNLFIGLLLAMAITVALGMGMPVVAVYSLAATLIAPALVEMGLPLFETHLFLVYYSVLSGITPPIAVTAYLASAIAGERPLGVAVSCVRLALVGFVLPFVFCYNPEILMRGTSLYASLGIVTAFLGVYCLSVALEGWRRAPLRWNGRILFFLIGTLLILPEFWTDLVGGVLLGGHIVSSWISARRLATTRRSEGFRDVRDPVVSKTHHL